MDTSTPQGASSPPPRSRRYVWGVALGLVALLVAGTGAYRWYARYVPCEVSDVEESSIFLTTQLNSYDRVYQVAVSASRDSLDLPVVTMQQILVDTQQVPVPGCMQTAKLELISYMEVVIRAFRAWGAGESDRQIRDLLDQSLAHYGKFRRELKAVDECAPFCFR